MAFPYSLLGFFTIGEMPLPMQIHSTEYIYLYCKSFLRHCYKTVGWGGVQLPISVKISIAKFSQTTTPAFIALEAIERTFGQRYLFLRPVFEISMTLKVMSSDMEPTEIRLV